MIGRQLTEPRPLVIVIDDNTEILWALSLLLESSCFEVQSWSSGHSFLIGADLSQRERPTCILTDVKMPDMDGLKLLNVLKANGNTFPVIVMTGEADIPTAVHSMKAGAFDFIEKPFESAHLIALIRSALVNGQFRDADTRPEVEEAQARLATLKPRELAVLRLAIQGKPNKAIAFELNLSQRTVELYRARALKRLSIRSMAEAASLATLAGFNAPHRMPASSSAGINSDSSTKTTRS